MATNAVTDALAADAARGEPAALRAVYENLAPAVLGYLRARGASDPEASTQDVFLALLPRLPRLSGGAAGLRTLAFSIAHARLVDDARARARRPPTISYEADEDDRQDASAEDDAQDSLATQKVLRVLDLLPDDQREVLTLRVVADLSVEQVAEVMGRSSGAIKQLQRRALIALRQALADRRVTL